MVISELVEKGYERIVRCQDEASGLDAVIAIHNTKLGPALGGTRFAEYAVFSDQLEDAMRLSKGMTYKNSLCGNDLGGGKAVINKRLIKDKQAAFKVYADFVNTLNGDYITAGDVGTTQEDLLFISQHTKYIGGVDLDSSLPTAQTVFYGMTAALDALKIDQFSLAVGGLGKVGSKLIKLAYDSGRLGDLCVAEIFNPAYDAWSANNKNHSRFTPKDIHTADATVYSPCALGKAINGNTMEHIESRIVCGAANNQLEYDEILQYCNFLYVPDYLVNGGGVIAVSGKYAGLSEEQIEQKLKAVYNKSMEIITESLDSKYTTVEIANSMAEDRLK
jgi:glutamate dehydrogenase/leucine dehydrogenase